MAGVIQRNGDGQIIRIGGVILRDTDCSCCGCSCSGAGTCYRIKTYTNSFFDTSGCLANCPASALGAWDGTFTNGSPSCADLTTWSYAVGGTSIGGVFKGATTITYEATGGSGGTCRWHMVIRCTGPSDLPGNRCLIWEGEKTSGSTPAGTYTRLAGSDTGTTSLIVEACP